MNRQDTPSQDALSSAIQALHKLAVGEEAWCWMLREDSDAAVMVVRSCRKDPRGEAFVKRVKRIQRQRTGATIQGVIRRLPSGSLSLTVRQPLPGALRIHAAVCRSAAVGAMPDLTLIQVRDGALVDTAQATNLSQQSAFLASLSAGEKGVFYLMTGEALSAPRLLLAADRDALKSMATTEKARIQRKGHSVRGQLRRSRSGRLEFHTSSAHSDLLTDLSTWAERHGAHWPHIAPVRDARAA